MMLDVFQKHLDQVSAAFMAGDFDSYMRLVAIPLVVFTDTGTAVVTDPKDFRLGFEIYVSKLKTERATDLIRLASGVTSYGPKLLTGRYETHILRSGQRIYGPHVAAQTLRKDPDGWKVTSLVNPVFHKNWMIQSYHAPTDPATDPPTKP
jgi:ketosteroid isomerase-like protein